MKKSRNVPRKKKINYKELLCLRCGNPIPFIRNKDYIICSWCGNKNDKEELGCLKNYGKQSKSGVEKG